MTIAYHSHGTSNSDRTLAANIATAMRECLLTETCPDPLRNAVESTERCARDAGYGTLLWFLEEHELPADQALEFMMRPENAHLVEKALDTLTPEGRERLRSALITAKMLPSPGE
jgi:hypothetical protein